MPEEMDAEGEVRYLAGVAKHDDWAWLRSEIEDAVAAFVAQLGALDGSTKVPNLDWTVAELTAHLASLPALYRTQHQLAGSFEAPPDWASFSVRQRAHIPTDELDTVTALLETEITGYLDEVEAVGDPDAERWLYGCRTTGRNIAGAILAELIVHGQDLARLGGTKPTLTSDQAAAAIGNTMAIVSAFVDPDRARKVAGTYHMRFRGVGDWTFVIDEAGTLMSHPGRPDTADARMSADPAAFLLVSLGRMNQFLPALTGKIVAYGRRPWRLMAVGNIAVDGV